MIGTPRPRREDRINPIQIVGPKKIPFPNTVVRIRADIEGVVSVPARDPDRKDWANGIPRMLAPIARLQSKAKSFHP
jgi:hypothetical protein